MADRLVWKASAEIRVENAPAFVHRLHVDPRLKIDSISIQEDNVERLVRYSRSGPDVTLFLRDRAAATQDLVLVGSMSIEVGRETKLPGVDVIGATVSDARLLLEPGPQVDMAVINAPSPSAVSREDRDEDRASRRSREYLLVPDAPLPSVRVTARNEPPHVDSVTVLTPAGSHSVDVDVYLRMTGTQGEQGPFEISIPSEVAQRSTITSNVDKQVRPLAGGSTGVLLQGRQGIDPVVEIRWSQTPAGDTWRIPTLSVSNAQTSPPVLLIGNALAWRPVSDSGIAVQSTPRTEWIRRRLPEGQSLSGWQLAEPDANSWVLHRAATASNRAAAARAYVNLFLAADGSSYGSLYLLIEQPTEPMLTIRWPQAAFLRAALLDGKPIQPASERGGLLAFALGPERKVHRLALHWLRSSERGLSLMSRVSEEIPVPVDLEVKSLLAEASVPAAFRAIRPSGFQSLGPGLFAEETTTIVTVGDAANDNEGIGAPQMPAFSSDSRTTLLGRLDLDHNFGAMRIWVYRDWLATVPLSVIAFAVVCAALVWASTSKVGAWLASGQPLVLAVIGAVWWAFLSPRVIGIALAVAALIWFTKKQRIVEPGRRDRLPSTLHLPG